MTEQQLNTTIGTSMDWHYKIGDAGKFKKPFDGVAIHGGKSIYWESKLIKKPQAFNFTRLEDHQIYNLMQVYKLAPDAIPLFLICVQFARGDNRVFVFRDMPYIAQRKRDRISITKKEFERRKNYVNIHKQLINIDELLAIDKNLEYESDL
jgi:penicillin-binding protein-related factor A (putative recombinase)